jgi:hypothetical protein
LRLPALELYGEEQLLPSAQQAAQDSSSSSSSPRHSLLELTTLRQLQELHLERLPLTSPAVLALLARLPRLQQLSVACVEVELPEELVLPQLAQLLLLEAAGEVRIALSSGELDSCLAQAPGAISRVMPQLQELRCAPPSLVRLAMGLWGHRQLLRLKAELGGAAAPEQWQGRLLLCELPALQRLELSGLWVEGADALLADAAACPALRELVVRQRAGPAAPQTAARGALAGLLGMMWPWSSSSRFSGAGLLALARGRCTLRRLVIDTGGAYCFKGVDVAALGAMLPALCLLDVPTA